MKAYETSRGHLFDLEHVLAIGPVTEDYKMDPPHYFTLTLAFNSKLAIGADTKDAAKLEHAKVQAAWLEYRLGQQGKMPAAKVGPIVAQEAAAAPPPPPPPPPAPTATTTTAPMDEVAWALAQAGVSLVNGVPVSRPAGAPAAPASVEDATYRSPFI